MKHNYKKPVLENVELDLDKNIALLKPYLMSCSKAVLTSSKTLCA